MSIGGKKPHDSRNYLPNNIIRIGYIAHKWLKSGLKASIEKEQ